MCGESPTFQAAYFLYLLAAMPLLLATLNAYVTSRTHCFPLLRLHRPRLRVIKLS